VYDWVDRLVCWIQWLTDLQSKSKKLLIVLTDIWRKNILLLRSNAFIYNNPVNGPLSTMSCASRYQKNKAVNHRRPSVLPSGELRLSTHHFIVAMYTRPLPATGIPARQVHVWVWPSLPQPGSDVEQPQLVCKYDVIHKPQLRNKSLGHQRRTEPRP